MHSLPADRVESTKSPSKAARKTVYVDFDEALNFRVRSRRLPSPCLNLKINHKHKEDDCDQKQRLPEI